MMHVNAMLAKALQKDMLRTAWKDRLARQIETRRKKRAALTQQKVKPHHG